MLNWIGRLINRGTACTGGDSGHRGPGYCHDYYRRI